MISRFWAAPGAAWIAGSTTILGMLAVWLFVDLNPRVESSFFFSVNDPQLTESLRIHQRYPGADRVIVRAGGDVEDPAYQEAVGGLATALTELSGVNVVNSLASESPEGSPLWSRVLSVPDSSASNLVVELSDDVDMARLLVGIERVLSDHSSSTMSLVVSGAPIIVERIRRSLLRDLIVFSCGSLAIFGLLLVFVYRDARTVVGALSTCLAACAATLLVIRGAGIGIGLLTANIITIVFVLTLSHVLFLTANWESGSGGTGDARRPNNAGRSGRDGPVADPLMRTQVAVRATLEPSTWAMLTTFLGFLSLLAASAKPLRDLGMAGAVGTLTAMATAYALYPAFLVSRGRAGAPSGAGGEPAIPRSSPQPASGRGGIATAVGNHRSLAEVLGVARRRAVLGAVVVAVLLLGFGVRSLDTDPGLLSYFAPGGDIRLGLEQIDQEGGSSPLEVLVVDPEGRIDSNTAYDKMWMVQDAFEADRDVGVVLSPAVVIAEAKRQPLAGLLSIEVLLDLADLTESRSSIRTFIYPDRSEGHFSLRMREGGRTDSRQAVISRLEGYVLDAGLEIEGVAGQYDLQRQLGVMIRNSIILGLGALLVLFSGVAFFASRSVRITALMLVCLAGIPLVVLGLFGHLSIAVDIITSPAANLALAMGVDSMIHLVVRWRRLSHMSTPVGEGVDPWWRAREELLRPVIAVSTMICLGFGIFTLSAFPPTQRFGLAVILGTATAAFMALVVLPLAASRAGVRKARPVAPVDSTA